MAIFNSYVCLPEGIGVQFSTNHKSRDITSKYRPAIERMLVSLILSWDNPSLWCQWIVLKMDLEDSHPIEHNSLVVINATPNR